MDTFSHPDFTVGSGVSPDRALVLPLALAGCTAGQDLHAITRHAHQSPKAMLPLIIHWFLPRATPGCPRHAMFPQFPVLPCLPRFCYTGWLHNDVNESVGAMPTGRSPCLQQVAQGVIYATM